jgi:hypothetical protein
LVNFDDLDNPQILRGKPRILKSTFRGKSIEISRLKKVRDDETVIIIKSIDYKNFSCRLDKKKKNIDVQIG